jgi:L,D-peptidoglycan transpeptidase YkuD (ErfK/YbiS/YcfS/YnhG family)
MPRILAACLGLIVSAEARGADAACPAFLAQARSLVVVTAGTMDTTRARLRRFERIGPSDAWQPVGKAEPAVVGTNGLAWGDPFRAMAQSGEQVKAEGDHRTPAGIYRIGPSFGATPSARPGHLVLRPGQSICVDDPTSPANNKIVSPTPGATPRGEDMGAEPLYRRGLVIDYPTDAGRRAGSCIFLHVWRGPASGTAGCVALPEPRVAALQELSGRGNAAIAILPDHALGRFEGCVPDGIR